MSIPTQRSRTIRKRHELAPDSDTHPIQRWVAADAAVSKPVLKTQYIPDDAVTSQNGVEGENATLSQAQSMPGKPLDWSGFACDMPSAVSKELLTDWRYDC